MKTFNSLWLGLAALALIATGCSKEQTDDDQKSGKNNGRMTVRIKAAESQKRSLLGDVTDDALGLFENNVVSFTAHVFNWTTGAWEASAPSDVSGQATFTNLNTAGTKRILVIANGSTLSNSVIPAFINNHNYSRMAEGYVMLQDQVVSDLTDMTRGFLMTGENAAEIQLVAGDNPTQTVVVTRVVAKVQLGTITFDKSIALSDLVQFNLTGAGIQRAIDASTINVGDVSIPTGSTRKYYGAFSGGAVSDVSNTAISNALGGTVLDLNDSIVGILQKITTIPGLDVLIPTDLSTIVAGNPFMTLLGNTTIAATNLATGALTSNLNAFWYVLPSNDSVTPTLLTLKGTFKGTPYYYPVEINTPAMNESIVTNDGKGTYIKRNTIYTINLTFKNLSGTSSPDEPGKPANIIVEVEPQEWEGPIIQNTTW